MLALRSEIEPLIPVFAAASEVAERVRKNPVLANIIANLEDVPSPPVLYFDLREQVENESGDLDTMADIAARDPSLVARILKVANSGFYSLPRSVSDLSQALGLIGTDGLLGMVLAAHLYAGLPPPGLKLELLWQHTLRVSALAREIARIEGSDRRVQSQCAVAGLLHDIGILVLLENEPERYQPIWKRSGGDETILAELERAEFGVTHGELGALILMLWSLPEDVVEAVRHSHSVCPIENPAPSVVVKSVLAAEWLLDNQADEKLPSSLLDLDAGNLATWVEERDIINNQHLAV